METKSQGFLYRKSLIVRQFTGGNFVKNVLNEYNSSEMKNPL